MLSPLLSPTVEDLSAGLALFRGSEALGAFDAVLAASAIRTGISAIVSADSGFAGLAEIAYVVPDRAGLSGLLLSG